MMNTKINNPGELEELRRSILAERNVSKPGITVCGGTGCHAYGCQEVVATFREEIERLGQALMRLEETVRKIARQFDLSPDDLNLDLGPLGRLR